MTQFDLTSYLRQSRRQVEAALDRYLPLQYPEKLYESMRYSLLGGGKRLRPILCLTTNQMCDGTSAMALPTACALEMVHTMSLIHDDLPAMDDDEYRRGQKTNHIVFGEDMAILAGDALLAYAFQLIAEQTVGVSPERVVRVLGLLGKAASGAGLVGGQVVDLASEGQDIALETLEYIHIHKTGALLEVSVISGAILAGAAEAEIERLTRYSRCIGLAFQIKDDLLDITGTQQELGKTAGKDLRDHKATYPSLLGYEGACKRAEQLFEEAVAELAIFGKRAEPLTALAEYIVRRSH
ncbi:geranylgeranyl diphosphate synthase CrtE [Gloeobacter kilaueensis]|uniref:dimethylallyltranstransferase n=1 Tax=Gloeobacter kilaueensis (strain ATCC BAA-2537 / CCAP 1431/1 / ULC 316 / JS1) TaxID=1183438 RepID=U5QJI8_GLOK1|nr:farnesyl diphosphate synthase [Gloeobacter kilaueensis]AGY57800.1 polyprenyl synthetase [Gloeobacter kilaueensis JS1]